MCSTETGGALAVCGRGVASVPWLDDISLKRLVATMEPTRECQRCVN